MTGGVAFAVFGLLVGCGTSGTEDAAAAPSLGSRIEPRLGGQTTAFEEGPTGFNLPARNFGLDDDQKFVDADVIFEHFFEEEEGLGPRYSAESCTGCHVNNGRSPAPPDDGSALGQGFVVLSVDEATRDQWGERLETDAIDTVVPEGPVRVRWRTHTGAYPDGTIYELRSPVLQATGGGWLVPRIAPHLAGTGLLEAIPEADIVALADPDDVDGDGISGRARRVDDFVTGETDVLGRFGWRAAQPTVDAQTASAYFNDMGISTGLDPTVDDPELSAEDAGLSSFYAGTIAVPAMRDHDDPDVRAGADLFEQVGCVSCHTPDFRTERVETRALGDQHIWPYTDLLLHDMGPGLTEPGTDPDVADTEWRTPPLWSLGMHDVINGHRSFLHDGRARTPEEAILWHGGEADASRRAFVELTADERARLLGFLAAL